MPLRMSLSLCRALLQCLQCNRLIGESSSLENGQCPCGAVLISVSIELNSLESNQTETAPGFFGDISFDATSHISDESPAAPSPNKGEERDQDDISIPFCQQPGSRSNSSARRPKRRQAKLSDARDDEETTANIKRERQNSSSFNAYMEQSNITPFSDDSGSEYQPSNSEDMSLLEVSQDTQRATKKNTRDGRVYQEARAASTTSLSLPSFASTSSSLPATAPRPDRPPGLLQFNKEIRGQLAKKNTDKSPQELTKIITDMWNKLTEKQKESYTDKSIVNAYRARRGTKKNKSACPPSNGYALFITEHRLQASTCASSKLWNGLNPEIKRTYNQRAKEIRDDWVFENPDAYQAYVKAAVAKRLQTMKASRNTRL